MTAETLPGFDLRPMARREGLPSVTAVPSPGPPFRTILADPPWRFENWSNAERAVRGEQWARSTGRSPYDCMDTDDLCRLPVATVAAPGCTLLLWTTNPKLPDAFRVIEAWGFAYRSMLTWVKMSRAAAPRIGLGYHARSATEHLLIASRGQAPAPDVADRPCSAIFHPIGRHSAKPDFQYTLAENYPGPWLELFCRPRWGPLESPPAGWTFLGNEVDGRDIRAALETLANPPTPRRECFPVGEWLSVRERPALAVGAPVRFLGQDGAALSGHVTACARSLDLLVTHKDGKPLAAPIPYTFGRELPPGLEVLP